MESASRKNESCPPAQVFQTTTGLGQGPTARPKKQGNEASAPNGAIHQKDPENEEDLEQYLSCQKIRATTVRSIRAQLLCLVQQLQVILWKPAGSRARDQPMPFLANYGQVSNRDHACMPEGVLS